VAAAVLDGGADLGFVEGPDLPPALASHQVGTDRLTVVVPPGHPWERRRSGITAAELAATPLVAREPGSGTRRYFEEALQAQGGLGWVPPVAELSSTTAIKSAVAAGIGPAVLSSLAVAPELSAGTLRAVRVTDLDLSRRLLAVWAAGRQLIGPAADLRAIAARTQATTGKNLPVAEAVDETAEANGLGLCLDNRSFLGKGSKITLHLPVPGHARYGMLPPSFHLLQGGFVRQVTSLDHFPQMFIFRLYNLISCISMECDVAGSAHLLTCHCLHNFHSRCTGP